MGDILAIIEQRDGTVRGSGREILTAARSIAGELGGQVHALVIGGDDVDAAGADLGRYGADKVLVASHGSLGSYHPEGYAEAVRQVAGAGGYGTIVLAASAAGKDLAPRVAASLDMPMVADVTGLQAEGGRLRVTRPVFSGKAFATLSMDGGLVTIRPNTFQPREDPAAGTVEAMAVTVDPGSWKLSVREFSASSGGALDVTEAHIVVSGGRGMKGPENWGVLEELRDALGNGATLGASRAVVDAGWRPHGEQVGQTGKTVSPQLYVAVGISGAIQHLAGMRSAKTIVAVNKDRDAPIFQVADYGVVGDLFEVVPAITREVQALKAQG
jgi:electron transfer flavoprotein alpha subunit